MNVGSDRGTMPDGTQLRRWNKAHTAYRCADGVDLLVSNRALRRGDGKVRLQTTCVNTIVYKISTKGKKVRLFISGLEFNRGLSRVVRGAKNIKTAIFPSNVREVSDGAFKDTDIISVIPNEGLEVLGECKDNAKGIFNNAMLKQVVFPSTLRVLGNKVFYHCEWLRHVKFPKDSRLERIEK